MSQANPKILIADDDPLARLFVKNALEPAGMVVLEATGGKDALAKFEAIGPDLVILDIMMPDMDGYLTCSRIRSLPRGKRVPILVLTGLDDAQSIGQAYQHGATDFITKPVNATILCHHVRYMLRTNNVLHALIRSESRLELAQRIARIGNWDWNPKTNRFAMSNELCRLVGVRPQDFAGTFEAFLALVHADDRSMVTGALQKLVGQHTPCDIDHRIVLPNGTDFVIHLQAEGVREEETDEITVIGTAQDITERKQAERAIHQLAYYDSLTGLANRVLFKDRLSNALSYASRHHQHLATLFIDLDRFKIINDTLGHAAGDQLLVMIAERLRGALRVGDVHGGGGNAVARFGGDEFVVLLADARTPEHALRVARQLLALFAEPYQLAGQAVHSSVSIGIAMGEPDGRSAEDLLRDADIAMYEAKRAGRATAVFFDPCMHQRLKRDLAVEIALRQAIERHEFSLVYQPVIDLETGDVTAVEALLRWTHPELGEVQPTEFVPLAEETSLIVPIGEWVLRQACQHFVHWCHTLGDRAPPVLSVNMSRVQMLQADRLVAHVMAVLAETGMPANRLQLEITERELTKDPLSARALMHRLRTLGLRLALDDFGTGGSTLTCLRDHPFDLVKIDRSLLHGIADNPDVLAVVHATVTLIENLGMASVAEGVEDAAHIGILQSIGCRYAQGFLFALPMSAQAVAEMPAMAPTPVLPPPMLQAYPVSHRLS